MRLQFSKLARVVKKSAPHQFPDIFFPRMCAIAMHESMRRSPLVTSAFFAMFASATRPALSEKWVETKSFSSKIPIIGLQIQLAGENLKILPGRSNEVMMRISTPSGKASSNPLPDFGSSYRSGIVSIKSGARLGQLLPLIFGENTYSIELFVPPELSSLTIESTRSDIVVQIPIQTGKFRLTGGSVDLYEGCNSECKIEIFGSANIKFRHLHKNTFLRMQGFDVGSKLFLPEEAVPKSEYYRGKFFINKMGATIKIENIFGIEILPLKDLPDEPVDPLTPPRSKM